MSISPTLFPLAAAAGGGSVDGVPATQLVAAGFTLLQRSAPLVRSLAGRRAAIFLPTSAEFLTALAACDGRGAVLINPAAAPAEIGYQLADAGVGAVFTNSALASRLAFDIPRVLLDDGVRSARVIVGEHEKTVDLGSHAGLVVETETDAPGRDEECAVVYTSAMAGKALGARLTHRNLIANARQTILGTESNAGTHCLAVLPFAHLFGLTVTLLSPLLTGGRVTTMARFNPLTAADLMENGGITLFTGVPAVYAGMLAAIGRRGGKLRSPTLRVCLCGGAVLPVQLQDQWFEATGVELRQGYGLTEASPVVLFNDMARPNRRGSLGVPLRDVEVTIRDPESNAELPTGTAGEICVRGETVFSGYVRGGADGLQVRDGWLASGDHGVKNADGTVSFLGLIKAMFTRNGFNVYPKEVERVIAELPGVRMVRVFAVPAAGRENDVGVAIEGAVSEDEVKRWCESRLGSYKLPTVIEISA